VSAERLLELLDVRREVRSTIRAVVKRELGPDIAPDTEKRIDGRIRWREFESRLAMLFEEHFSDEEIKVLIRFMEKPLARKFMSRMVEMDSVITDLSLKMGEQIGQAIQAELDS